MVHIISSKYASFFGRLVYKTQVAVYHTAGQSLTLLGFTNSLEESIHMYTYLNKRQRCKMGVAMIRVVKPVRLELLKYLAGNGRLRDCVKSQNTHSKPNEQGPGMKGQFSFSIILQTCGGWFQFRCMNLKTI